MISRFIVLTLFLSTAMLRAADEKGAPEKPSSFLASRISRDPFTRIDANYLAERNAVVVPAGDATDGDLAKLFRVTAVSIDRLSIAVINRKALAENETFTMRNRDKDIRVKVLKVTQDGVELNYGGTVLSVPIVREKASFTEESP